MTLQTFVSTLLSWLTVAGQIFVLLLIALLVLKKQGTTVVQFVKKHGMTLSLIVALFALLGSLTYSDILMIEPCKLCWYQRIFMYPQVILLALGIYLKDTRTAFYSLIFSLIGFPIALYHYLLQRGVVEAGCSVVGNYSVSCSSYFKLYLGYITIPMMAATAFLMIATFLYIYRTGETK